MSDNFSREQAEALASAMFRLVDSQLVSKAYLDQRLAQLKMEIVQYVVGALILQSGAITALVKLLP
jgi:hypothetical protein